MYFCLVNQISITIYIRLKIHVVGRIFSLKCILIEFAELNQSSLNVIVHQKSLKPVFENAFLV